MAEADPITAERDETAADPVELVKVGGEIYTLVVDYSVIKTITRLTGINPLMRHLISCMETEDGIEVCLWAMISQAGPNAEIPKDHRNLKRKTVAGWLEDIPFAVETATKMGLLWNKSVMRGDKKEEQPDGVEPEDENSDPPTG